MEKIALIDVSNTKRTTRDALGFSIDWKRLLSHLKGEKWMCSEVIYYEGKMDTKKYAKKHKKLESIGYIIRTKRIFLHKKKELFITFTCTDCEEKNKHKVSEVSLKCNNCEIENLPNNHKGHNPKANFDVEIAVDGLDRARPGTEILIFTGDGDFSYLARKMVEKGAFVTFVSTKKPTRKNSKRFSTRLQDLISEEEIRAKELEEKPRVRLLEIDNWKMRIQKENAAKRDVSD